MQTARRTGTSIRKAFDHDITAFDNILQHLFRRRLGMRRFFEAQHLVPLVGQQLFDAVEELCAAFLRDRE